ncbi:MAG: MarR family transcriptional regulator [Parvularculales bacterium]
MDDMSDRSNDTEQSVLSCDFNLETSLCHLLYRARQHVEGQLAHSLSESGLTPRQFIVLLSIRKEEGLTQSDLVSQTGIDSSTLGDMISRLLTRGLVVRRRLKRDGRLTAVRLSASGRRLLERAAPAAEAVERTLTAHISPQNLTQLLETLKRLPDSLLQEEEQSNAVPWERRFSL